MLELVRIATGCKQQTLQRLLSMHSTRRWLAGFCVVMHSAARACVTSTCSGMQVDCEVGQPRVNYRETIQSRAEFDYLHKKQSGGQVSISLQLQQVIAAIWEYLQGQLLRSLMVCIVRASHSPPLLGLTAASWQRLTFSLPHVWCRCITASTASSPIQAPCWCTAGAIRAGHGLH